MTLFVPPTLLDSSRWRGLRVGLLGGSFNPPHKGHIHISKIALRALHLDVIWWLVSPQNPLKSSTDTLPLEERIDLCRGLASNPQIIVSDIEGRLGTNRTFNTVRALRDVYTGTSFVWLTGLDNALTFHKWYRWKEILDLVPTAHVVRPPALNVVKNCPLRLYTAQNHIHVDSTSKQDLLPHRTFWLLQRKMLSYSSTEIRNKLDL